MNAFVPLVAIGRRYDIDMDAVRRILLRAGSIFSIAVLPAWWLPALALPAALIFAVAMLWDSGLRGRA